MGKRKLITRILAGAAVGGIVALFDREARDYTVEKLASVKDKSVDCLKNPEAAIHNVRTTIDRFNQNVSTQAENAINALEQVEETLGKVMKKTDRIEGN